MFTLLLAITAAGTTPHAGPPALKGAEDRALAYLAREVPLWSRKNHCYSCHHNGDAARALYIAVGSGRFVPANSLADTTRWLERPARWDHNGGEGGFSDKKLASLQFAASLSEAFRAGLAKDKRALELAAHLVVKLQDMDGSWRIGNEDAIGSPATHGTALATHLARLTLQRAGSKRYRDAIRKADRWLRKTPIETILDAAAVLLALGAATDAPALAQKRRCLEQLRKGESRRGGWGPRARTPTEVFDTAVVLLALAAQEQTGEVATWVKRGRAFLLAAQEKDGSWEETTRPSGSASYAQRLSTAAWATLALLATREKEK